MPVSRGFLDHALDLLSLAGPVRARAMFGGYGLYLRDAMFGLLDDDEIFLKTDDACRQEFVDAGCEQWVYPSPKGPMATQYFRPPDDAHEDAEAMLPWAGLAIAAARRAARDKAEKAKAREGRKRTGARKKVARKGRRK
ncbi:MAG TPA: TfoX/Sxy family protein [Anaeromyxobacteraceae bacterium]|nr:TfoX/Sxy family protein [Anaeromyxobacteraceae bacterium]